MTVTDPGLETDSDTATVTIAANQAPSASVPGLKSTLTTITLTPSGSEIWGP